MGDLVKIILTQIKNVFTRGYVHLTFLYFPNLHEGILWSVKVQYPQIMYIVQKAMNFTFPTSIHVTGFKTKFLSRYKFFQLPSIEFYRTPRKMVEIQYPWRVASRCFRSI